MNPGFDRIEPTLADVYAETIRFAADAHKDQKFPGTDISYLMHLCMVCMEALEAARHDPEQRFSEETIVRLALLHDTIEDTDVTYEQVKEQFGTVVADGVLALTKNASLEKSQRMGDSLERIRRQPPEVWAVKLSDRICNMAPAPAYWSSAKKAQYRDEAIEILKALGSASRYLAERLASKIAVYSID